MDKYYPPTFIESSFNCPYCNVYAHQYWRNVYYEKNSFVYMPDCRISECAHCSKISFWFNEILVIPYKNTAPLPHEDLPQELLEDYLEAASIVNKSPRGAAALLRLVLQKLMIILGETGRDINKDIASLVQKGLASQVQQALDIVRVIGNESVHPGQLDIKDDVTIATQLFTLINFIVEEMVTKPKTIQALFDQLPQGKREGIESRDKIKTPE